MAIRWLYLPRYSITLSGLPKEMNSCWPFHADGCKTYIPPTDPDRGLKDKPESAIPVWRFASGNCGYRNQIFQQ